MKINIQQKNKTRYQNSDLATIVTDLCTTSENISKTLDDYSAISLLKETVSSYCISDDLNNYVGQSIETIAPAFSDKDAKKTREQLEAGLSRARKNLNKIINDKISLFIPFMDIVIDKLTQKRSTIDATIKDNTKIKEISDYLSSVCKLLSYDTMDVEQFSKLNGLSIGGCDTDVDMMVLLSTVKDAYARIPVKLKLSDSCDQDELMTNIGHINTNIDTIVSKVFDYNREISNCLAG